MCKVCTANSKLKGVLRSLGRFIAGKRCAHCPGLFQIPRDEHCLMSNRFTACTQSPLLTGQLLCLKVYPSPICSKAVDYVLLCLKLTQLKFESHKMKKTLSNGWKWADYLPCYHVTDLISEHVSDFSFGRQKYPEKSHFHCFFSLQKRYFRCPKRKSETCSEISSVTW